MPYFTPSNVLGDMEATKISQIQSCPLQVYDIVDKLGMDSQSDLDSNRSSTTQCFDSLTLIYSAPTVSRILIILMGSKQYKGYLFFHGSLVPSSVLLIYN